MSIMPWMITIILLTLLDSLSSEVACNRLADIFWNATNPIFRIDNTDHIIDVNKNHLQPSFEYDQVNIICPVYPHSNPGTLDDDHEEEQYIIYNVSKEEYDSCRITNPNPRIIAVCDKPNTNMYFTITFRSFTPQPGGLEFLPGHDYYFVSTSTGDDKGLHQRVGGRCATHNMKVIFKVCCDPNKGPPPGATNPKEHPHNSTVAPSRVAPSSSTQRPPHTTPRTALRRPPSPPPAPREVLFEVWPNELPVDDEMDRSPPPQHKDKGNPFDDPPHKEEAKNEELVNGASLRIAGAYFYVTCCGCCLLQRLLLALLHR